MLYLWPCVVIFIVCTSLRGAVSCGGRDVQEIATVLEDLDDWEALAGWLDIRMATINNINKNCPSYNRAQCQWRELVRTYCDGDGDGDPYKTAADIAIVLDSKMRRKKQAQKLKQLKFTRDSPDKDYEGYCSAENPASCTGGSPDQDHEKHHSVTATGYAAPVRPVVQSLGIKDLKTVLKEIKDVNKKWKFLGLELGLLQPTLDGISSSDYEVCKMEMIQKWLNKDDPDCHPSWKSLVEALRSDLVQHKPIADEIERKYLK